MSVREADSGSIGELVVLRSHGRSVLRRDTVLPSAERFTVNTPADRLAAMAMEATPADQAERVVVNLRKRLLAAFGAIGLVVVAVVGAAAEMIRGRRPILLGRHAFAGA